MIKSLNQRGAFMKDIAEELGVPLRTVSRTLKRGSAPKRERKRSECKPEPYKPKINLKRPEAQRLIQAPSA